MEKTRLRPRLRSKGLSLEIRSKANAIPLKSLIYAIKHATLKLSKKRNSNSSLYSYRLATHARELSRMVDNLKLSSNIDPEAHSKIIRASARLYVDLFYALSQDERKVYIQSFSGKSTRIRPESNLLMIPALMAEFNQPKEEVAQTLHYALYRMPFRILYDSSKSALHLALLEQNMAIKSVPYEVVEQFSQSMAGLGSTMKAIEGGSINPNDDEDAKAVSWTRR